LSNVPTRVPTRVPTDIAAAAPLRAPRSQGWARRALSGLAGMLGVVFIWWLAIRLIADPNGLAAQFSPARAAAALPSLITDDRLLVHIVASLRRIAVGLAWALLLGVPLGFLLGRVRALDTALSPTSSCA
jgi:NitT/TauT family transport system permease protein